MGYKVKAKLRNVYVYKVKRNVWAIRSKQNYVTYITATYTRTKRRMHIWRHMRQLTHVCVYLHVPGMHLCTYICMYACIYSIYLDAVHMCAFKDTHVYHHIIVCVQMMHICSPLWSLQQVSMSCAFRSSSPQMRHSHAGSPVTIGTHVAAAAGADLAAEVRPCCCEEVRSRARGRMRVDLPTITDSSGTVAVLAALVPPAAPFMARVCICNAWVGISACSCSMHRRRSSFSKSAQKR